VRKCDSADARDFEELRGRYDTVVCLNVLEHVADERRRSRTSTRALQTGGRAIVLVPQNPKLHGTLDEVLGTCVATRASRCARRSKGRLRSRAHVRLQSRHDAGVVVERQGAEAPSTSAACS
jgi:2-polyprenyl-3-methyl-5-hydroxy-6-metoxy-1,4-benzoquinol methylase